MLLVRMMVVVMQLGWILHAGVDVLVSVIDRHVAVLQTRIALAGVDGRHLVTVRVVTVAASVSGCVRSGCVAPRDAVMTVAHFPVQFRFGFLHGVDRQRMRKSPLRAQRVVGSWARLIPKAVAGWVDVADVVLTRSRVRQIVTDLWPKVTLAPADENRRTKEETQFRIGLIVGPRCQENSNQTGARFAQETGQGRAYFGPGPFRLDEGLRDDQNDPAAGSQPKSQRISARTATAAAASGIGREVSVLQAKPERRPGFGWMLQFSGQYLRDKLLVLEAVADESVKHRLLPGWGRRGDASVQLLGFRVAESNAVAGKDPDADRLAVNEEEDDDDHAQKEEADSGGHHWEVVHYGSATEASHDADGRIGRAATVELVEANQLLIAHQAMKGIRIDQLVRMSRNPLLEIGQEPALAAPRVQSQRELVQMRIDAQSPKRERQEAVAIQPEDLERAQVDERRVRDEAKLVVLQVELSQVIQGLKFRAAELFQLVVGQLQHLKGSQSVESAVAQSLDPTAVEVQSPQILAADKGMARQLRQIVAVQIKLSGVHGDPFGQIVQRAGRSRAIDNVWRPGGVVIATAAGRTGHLAIAGIKVAAMAEGEAVGLVGAEEFFRPDVDQRHQRRLGRLVPVSTEAQTASDVSCVHQSRLLARSAAGLDQKRQPLEAAVALPRIVPQRDFGKVSVGRNWAEPQGGRIQRLHLVRVEVHSREIRLLQESVGCDARNLVVVDEQLDNTVRHAVSRQVRQLIETGVDGLQIGQLNLEVVAQLGEGVLVDVQPLDIGRQERVVE